ncbi:MAG: hypothetical protein WEE89_06135 [Gemmatimonadota bacterium]
MSTWCFYCVLIVLPALLPARGVAQVDDVVQGYLSGGMAGRQVNVMLPAVVSASTITLLTAIDHEPATNNRVVRMAITQAAIGASVSWVATRLLRAEPQASRYTELEQASFAYREGFRRGFFESMGNRQTVSNLMGVVVGSVVSGAIYKMRQ